MGWWRKLVGLSVSFCCLATFAGCGQKKEKDDGGPAVGKAEAGFLRSANESGVPARLMLAVSYLESRISPEYATAFYLAPGSDDPKLAKGLRLTQSAFGLPLSTFGLEQGADASKVEVQADRYAKWVKSKLGDLTLASHPTTSEDTVQWILRLAELHRDAKINKRNLQALFAREVINVLNEGFIWQDPRNGEVLRFPKEDPAIRLSDLTPATKKQLEIATVSGEVPGTRYFQLAHTAQPRGNVPRRVEVIHCPLALSACLMLQDSTDDEVRIGAHFAIPDVIGPEVVERVLQIHDTDEVVELTGNEGQVNEIKDAVVIMMTGNSGRYVDGVRLRANPSWLSESQLQMMGTAINDICGNLHQSNEDDRAKCIATEGRDGPTFYSQGNSKVYQWSQIADYDATIFNSYIREPGRKAGTAFEFPDQRHQYHAGESLNFALNFGSNAKMLVLQRLVRCPDQRLAWYNEVSVQTRTQGRLDFSPFLLHWYDSGPNNNGEQFLRAMVYGSSQKELLGWATDNVYITDFEKEGVAPIAPAACDN